MEKQTHRELEELGKLMDINLITLKQKLSLIPYIKELLYNNRQGMVKIEDVNKMIIELNESDCSKERLFIKIPLGNWILFKQSLKELGEKKL